MVTVTETCSKLYIIEYIVVFCPNDILVSAATQQDCFYQITSLDIWLSNSVTIRTHYCGGTTCTSKLGTGYNFQLVFDTFHVVLKVIYFLFQSK
jgi:hypothetical protein